MRAPTSSALSTGRRCARPAAPPASASAARRASVPVHIAPTRHVLHRVAAVPEGTAAAAASTTSVAETAPSSPSTTTTTTDNAPPPPTARSWQLDFSSRPVLDDRGKKVWELLVTDDAGEWVHAQFLPSNRINSTQLKLALEAVLAAPGAVRPDTVRFFRGGMQTIITRALTDLGVRAVPSRRCYALSRVLADRAATLYPTMPGFDADAAARPPFALELGAPADLPDALRGEAWSFVQLPWGDLQGELAAVENGEVFGSTFAAGAEPALAATLSADTPIPGVAVYSRRAEPLAAWTAGYEVAALSADTDRGCLVLETGVGARWRYGALGRSPADAAEARAWEEAKAGTGGLHFLVVQEGDGEVDVAGLWLLWDAPAPAA